MIAKLIRWSILNRFLVLLATVGITAWGIYALQRTPLDALPDLFKGPVASRAFDPRPAMLHQDRASVDKAPVSSTFTAHHDPSGD